MIDTNYAPKHFRWSLEDNVATVTLARPERKNPLTFDSYAELRDTFRALVHTPAVRAVVLAGCDMGACAILPRLIGHGRATDLLLTGRAMSAEEGERWGFYNRVVSATELLTEAGRMARELAEGPTFAHAITKQMLNREWSMSIDDALEAEAQAQALCMQTE